MRAIKPERLAQLADRYRVTVASILAVMNPATATPTSVVLDMAAVQRTSSVVHRWCELLLLDRGQPTNEPSAAVAGGDLLDDDEWCMGTLLPDGGIYCWATYGTDLESAVRAL